MKPKEKLYKEFNLDKRLELYKKYHSIGNQGSGMCSWKNAVPSQKKNDKD